MMVWFETILVALTALTGLVWLVDRLFLARRRAAAADPLEGVREPVVVDYSKAFFPILALVLGLAVAEGRLSADEAFSLSRIDEHWQIEQWGQDDEAAEIEAAKRQALIEAARFHELCR